MIKNKIVLGVGLLIGITAGVSFAENRLSGTDLIDKNHTQSIFFNDVIQQTESVTGKRGYYYNLKCYINNLLYPAEMNLLVQQIPNHFSQETDILLNNQKISRGNNGTATGMLQKGDNIIELKNLTFPKKAHVELKFSTNTTDYPGMGYIINYCTYTYSLSKASTA